MVIGGRYQSIELYISRGNRGFNLIELNLLKNISQNDLLENWIIALLFLNVTKKIDILGSSIWIRIDEMNSVFISEGFKCSITSEMLRIILLS